MAKDTDARIAGPASQTIRNTMKQTLILARDGHLSLMQLQLTAGVMSDCADQVERLEAMVVPEAQRADPKDIESRKVVMFDELKNTCGRVALGGAVSAPPRRRKGFWNQFQTFMRRI